MVRCVGACGVSPGDMGHCDPLHLFTQFSRLVGSCGLTFLPLICTHELFQAKPAFVLILVCFLNNFSV